LKRRLNARILFADTSLAEDSKYHNRHAKRSPLWPRPPASVGLRAVLPRPWGWHPALLLLEEK